MSKKKIENKNKKSKSNAKDTNTTKNLNTSPFEDPRDSYMKALTSITSNKKNKSILIIGSLAILFLGSSAFIIKSTSYYDNKSFDGIYLDDVKVGKLDKDSLNAELSEILPSKLDKLSLNLNYDSETLTIKLSDIGAYYDIDSICEEVLSYNKSGNLIKDTLSRVSLKLNNKDFIPNLSIDEDTLNNYIISLEDELNIAPINPKITFDGDSITVGEGKAGRTLDSAKLKKDILKAITTNIEDITINLKFNDTQPILTKDIAEKMVVLGSHKTKLPSIKSDRTSNIRLFMSKLNETVLAPGEEFSCDTRGGSREVSDGYKAAPGYINGKVVPIVAGGICQGTTTIYNAVLYADLEIVERHPHSMPVTYAENGRDAAIARGSKDLIFKNNTSNPLIVQTYVSSDGYVVAKIWGVPEEENKEIKISVKHLNSKVANAYKHTYINGELVKTETLSYDRYK